MKEELGNMKNDPVSFAEKYLGVKLGGWQKAYLRIQTKLKPLSRFKRY